ncbi:hypothetical protein CPB85DRAFT_1298465 [Mucidula mucida]|nr:hypothetical protein CPB85DRAFT_1298465 [Mucidula mucida]
MILNFPPGHMPSQEEIEEAGGHMEWRALLLERSHLEPHPIDWVMPARRFWPIHTAERKRVLSVFPIPQTLPPSEYMLQDAPKPVVCWNIEVSSKPPVQSRAKDKEQIAEKRDAAQGKVVTREEVESNGKVVTGGRAAPMEEVAAQDAEISVASTCEPLSAGSTVSSQPASPSKDEDVVMAEAPACSSSAATERQPSDVDVLMADPPTEGQPSPILREHNAQATLPLVSDSAPAKKRKRDDENSEDDLPPAKRTIDSKPSANGTSSKKASSLSQVTPKGTNQIPSPLGRPLYLGKNSPFPSPDDLVVPRPVTEEDLIGFLCKLDQVIPAQKIRSCLVRIEADPLFCRIRSLLNIRGSRAHRRNPSRRERDVHKWKQRVMADWHLVPSPLRSSVTLTCDEATNKYEFQRSCAFNHKWTVDKFLEESKKQSGEPGGTVVVAEPEENEHLGVLLPDGMPREPKAIQGWRLKGPNAVFTKILPGGRLMGREASAFWTGPAVSAMCLSDRAAGWTGQPLLKLLDQRFL